MPLTTRTTAQQEQHRIPSVLRSKALLPGQVSTTVGDHVGIPAVKSQKERTGTRVANRRWSKTRTPDVMDVENRTDWNYVRRLSIP
jgi:hypothetical protein